MKKDFKIKISPYSEIESRLPEEMWDYDIDIENVVWHEGDLVLDNTAGSGSLGLACQNTNRNFILIEKEKKYVNIIKERLKL